MVIVTIDSDFLSGKMCFEKQIRKIVINNDGSIVDATDIKTGQAIKKLELEVLLPDGKKFKWRPNNTCKKSLVKIFGTDSTAWNGKTVKIICIPFQDTYQIQVDELDTQDLNKPLAKSKSGGTLL